MEGFQLDFHEGGTGPGKELKLPLLKYIGLASLKWINLTLFRHSSPSWVYTHRENVKTGHKAFEMQLYY